MEQYKIYINNQGIIGAILLPEEPQWSTYEKYEKDGKYSPSCANFDSPSEEYNVDMKQYNEALTKAKKEFVPFRSNDSELIIQDIFSKYGKKGELIQGSHLYGTIHDLPDGYVVETIEYEAHDVRAKLKKI